MVAREKARHRLERTMFQTSRSLEYFSERELRYQTSRAPTEWPAVILRELVDNALDACEDAGTPPVITVVVEGDEEQGTITVSDNGPGITPKTLKHILNFTVRVSDKEAYVSPTRGAQGNALKTVLAIPYVASTEKPPRGQVAIVSRGVQHDIAVATDLLRQRPRIDHTTAREPKPGTSVSVALDYRGILNGAKGFDFYKSWLRRYALFNPHASFHLETPDWKEAWIGSMKEWGKWTPSDPTSPWWYTSDDLGRLVGAHIVHGEHTGRDLPLRELVAQFRGLSSTAKQKRVTTQFEQGHLSEFMLDGSVDGNLMRKLLTCLKAESKVVKPERLGVIGEQAFRDCLTRWYDLDEECFNYSCQKGYEGDLPFVLEIAFARKQGGGLEQYLGLNCSPSYGDPFAEARLSFAGKRDAFSSVGLGAFLAERKVQRSDPLVIAVHLFYPRPRFRDRGKTGLQLEEGS